MNITITGGSGFIGSNLVKALHKKHNITVFDINKTQINDTVFVQGNITDSKAANIAIKNSDIVIHLAATLGVINTEENPIKTLDTNIFGTKNVLDACKNNNVKKIIFSSSSEIYGEPATIPINETDKVMPITNYGISKLAAEEYIKAYSKNFGITYTILRLFNIYGEKQRNEWVMSEFVNQAIKNQEIMIHGTGSQIRAFCHVNDAVKGFEMVLEKGNNNTFNIGNDTEPVSIKELAKRIITLSNSKSTMKLLPFEKSNRDRNEIMNRSPNIEKIRKVGYKPEVSLNEGIKKIIDIKKELLDNHNL
jgi:UDP-glucose 4-epimerase